MNVYAFKKEAGKRRLDTFWRRTESVWKQEESKVEGYMRFVFLFFNAGRVIELQFSCSFTSHPRSECSSGVVRCMHRAALLSLQNDRLNGKRSLLGAEKRDKPRMYGLEWHGWLRLWVNVPLQLRYPSLPPFHPSSQQSFPFFPPPPPLH